MPSSPLKRGAFGLLAAALMWTLAGCSSKTPEPAPNTTEPAKPSATSAAKTPTPATEKKPDAKTDGKTATTPSQARIQASRPLKGAHKPKPKADAKVQTTPNGGPGTMADFSVYVLDLTWLPEFCCGNSSKQECKDMPGSFGADHFTLHGLWPNYSDAEQPDHDATYPTYCAPYTDCDAKTPADGCKPDHSTIPADMATYGPGYVDDDYYLADHEWAKHGSCTGLDSATYFTTEIDTLKALPGDQGTPKIVGDNIGKSVALADLQGAFGANPKAVLLGCDSGCKLARVGICFKRDDAGKPTDQIDCPKSTTGSSYDNSCVLNSCDQINLVAPNACD